MLLITENEKADLETIIDSRGLPLLLDAIANICRAKSEHCAVNWQDSALAKLWDARADSISLTCRLVLRDEKSMGGTAQ